MAHKACVVGGSGFLASTLIKLLLEKGYAVNTTVRDLGNKEKLSHILQLEKLGELKLFKADLEEEGSFEDAVAGCRFVFHVATPIDFASPDPENDMIKPAIDGVRNILKACAKAKTVKRLVYTSSAAAVSVNRMKGEGIVMTEENWSDVDFLRAERPHGWGYPVSKTSAEKAGWELAKELGVDFVSVIPALLAGPWLTPSTPHSASAAMSLLTGDDSLVNGLIGMQLLSGSISISHIEDVCRVHVFVAERDSAQGRYICCSVNTSVKELADFLSARYPQYNVKTDFGDLPAKAKLLISSAKLRCEGFEFHYGIEEIYDQSVEYFKAKGLLV